MPTDGYRTLRHAGETIAMQDVVVTPEEINAEPEDGATSVISRSAGGSISGLLSYSTYDDFIAAVMGIDWVDEKSFRVTDEKRFPTLRLKGDKVELEFHEETPILLKWPSAGTVRIQNLEGSEVEVPYRIINSDRLEDWRDIITFSRDDGIKILNSIQRDDLFARDTVDLKIQKIQLGAIVNSNLSKSFTIRKKINSSYQIFSGNIVSKIKFDFQTQQTPSIQIDFIGAKMNIDEVSKYKGPTPATTTQIMQASSFQNFRLGDSSYDWLVQSAKLTLTRNGATLEQGIGSVYPSGVQFGSFSVTLDLEIYLRSDNPVDLFFSGGSGPVSFTIFDEQERRYEVRLLNAKFHNASAPIDQKNKSMILHVAVTGNPFLGGGTLAIRRVG
ncbi:phage tail tube protein [Candidatus Kirkpatrickella diaphorinae]|uniref:Phage tail tube protein n=1 Tax=Candidatus Kirkpatrickella diaphorinae TaxID=2984322 RepID=A0ABY6GHA5_9PROT|nr:phage tail tube protein [Candidatus Kirkpatrickella diaphorinae]UYH50898.1 phage tail tube protein [Candidatus Kirkpatrickella diaphorinae]